MNIIEIINKKRQGKILSRQEIEFAVSAYTLGKVEDYQMSALLMAICTKGLTNKETYYITKLFPSGVC